MASGERRASELKFIRFEQTFEVPKNSDVEKTSGKFEGEILYVIVPKVKEQKEEPNEEKGPVSTVAEENMKEKPTKGDDKQSGSHGQSPENIDGERNKESERVDKVLEGKLDHGVDILESVISTLSKNKGIVVAAILAFSLGVFVGRKFE